MVGWEYGVYGDCVCFEVSGFHCLPERRSTWSNEIFLLCSARARSDLALKLDWKPEFDGTYLRSAIAEDMEVILRLTRI